MSRRPLFAGRFRRSHLQAAGRALALVMVLLGAVAATAGGEERIHAVAVETDSPVDAAAVAKILGLAVGQPLDRRQLRDSILAYYAGGEVERLEITSDHCEEGLDLRVRVSFRPKIAKVVVRAANPVLEKRVQKWLRLEVGGRASSAVVETARRRVVRQLRDRGHADPRVQAYMDYERATNSVDITIQVAAGPLQELEAVVLVGAVPPEVADAALPRVDAGTRLTARMVEQIRDETESRLRREGYWEAHVIGVDRIAHGARVTLQVSVDPGERYRLELDAPADTRKVVRAAIPDPAEEDLHPAQTDVLVERIRERLQEQGYLLATVRAELVTADGVRILRVAADPGTLRRIARVEFPGSAGISHAQLQEAVEVRPGAVRGLFGHPVSDLTLEQDRLALEQLYRRSGFVEAQVGTPIVAAQGPEAVTVSFPITEGRRWLLADLRVEGLPVEAAARLDKAGLPLAEAAPWDPDQVDEARRRLETILADTGYPEGRVTAEVDTATPGEAKVLLTAQPGPYVRLGRVVIAGLSTTHEEVVARVLRRSGVTSGAPFARDHILEAQRRLYALGLFRRVELLPLPGQEHRVERGLVVQCEEGRQRSYLVGFGWNETDRFRLTLGWSNLNLLGGAHAVSIETRLSSREQRYQLGIREPWVPLVGEPGYMVIYRTFEEFATYSQLRRGLWFEVGDRLRAPFRTWLRYEYQIVNPDAPPDVLSELERENQQARIASITPTLEWDYRNDPLNPTVGTFSSLSLEYAFPAFAADAQFLKAQGRFSLYGPILDGVGAVGIRLGAIQPLGPDTGGPPNLRVPLNARFFAGGASSHRAFRTDYLGVPGQTLNEGGDPIGGNALFLLNLEYSQPIKSIFSGVVFLDAGNVWASPSRVRVGDLRWGAGLGLRVDTPAGPLRAEYGFKLDREPGESMGAFFLSFGIPF